MIRVKVYFGESSSNQSRQTKRLDNMNLLKFKAFCSKLNPIAITYNNSEDKAYTKNGLPLVMGSNTQLCLNFDRFNILNPFTIAFIGESGTMYINDVVNISIGALTPIGNNVTISTKTTTGKRDYTFNFLFQN